MSDPRNPSDGRTGTTVPHEPPWSPREHDHLVEPVFGGLGVREPVPGPVRQVSGRALLAWAAVGAGAALGVLWLLLR